MGRIFCFLFLINFSCWAGMYPVVIPYKAVYDTNHTGYTTIYYKVSVMNIGPAADWVPPAGFDVGFVYHDKMYDNMTVVNAHAQTAQQSADGKKTIGELAIASHNTYVSIASDGMTDAMTNRIDCMTYGGGPTLGSSWSSGVFPGGCVKFPPVEDWCKITTPEIVLDHGTISLTESEGHSTSANIGLHCTNAMAVTFNLIANDKYVYLDEGKSEITIDNKPLNMPIDLASGDSSLVIKDMLTGVNTEGSHTGSSVLVMEPY
ncbi:hypothetical protein [Siccibacter turicensis]|uniref:hypothetical protein n=1 Tax=Siccibacter turicensis TaxID=357233 RepID=UPI002A69B573|nr:hypothetical protein [Siccibacter turicensis]MDY0972478.1 hypothetical protein [Siccibacter turicensis]